MNNSFSTLLNFYRWISALLVVASHCRHLILVDYKNVEHSNYFIKAIYFITGFGDEAVIIFFVISGFLVGGLTLDRWLKNISYLDYFAARFSRIYSVLIPALLIGGATDWIGSNFINKSEIYTNSSYYGTSSMGYVITNNLDPVIFFGNLLNLQGVSFSIWGSNGPLWSLGFEWWYYMIFALIMMVFLEKKIATKLISLLLIITFLFLFPAKLIIWMSIWLLGVGILILAKSSCPKPPRSISFILFISTLLISRLTHNTENLYQPESLLSKYIRDFSFGLSFAIYLLSHYNFSSNIPFQSVHKWLANFSYSIYLFHFPVFVFLLAVSHDYLNIKFMQQPNLYSCIFLLIIIFIIYLFGYVISLATENHTSTIRKFIITKFTRNEIN